MLSEPAGLRYGAHDRLCRAWQVAEALRGSETLVVSEDGRRVRRMVPMESPEVVARQVSC